MISRAGDAIPQALDSAHPTPDPALPALLPRARPWTVNWEGLRTAPLKVALGEGEGNLFKNLVGTQAEEEEGTLLPLHRGINGCPAEMALSTGYTETRCSAFGVLEQNN